MDSTPLEVPFYYQENIGLLSSKYNIHFNNFFGTSNFRLSQGCMESLITSDSLRFDYEQGLKAEAFYRTLLPIDLADWWLDYALDCMPQRVLDALEIDRNPDNVKAFSIKFHRYPFWLKLTVDPAKLCSEDFLACFFLVRHAQQHGGQVLLMKRLSEMFPEWSLHNCFIVSSTFLVEDLSLAYFKFVRKFSKNRHLKVVPDLVRYNLKEKWDQRWWKSLYSPVTKYPYKKKTLDSIFNYKDEYDETDCDDFVRSYRDDYLNGSVIKISRNNGEIIIPEEDLFWFDLFCNLQGTFYEYEEYKSA